MSGNPHTKSNSSCELRESMIPSTCADKRIGEPLGDTSLFDCGERCAGEEECEFHTYTPATSGEGDEEFTKGTCMLYRECLHLQLETVETTKRDEL